MEAQNTKMVVFQSGKAVVDQIIIEPTPQNSIQAGHIIDEEALSDFLGQNISKMEIMSEVSVITSLSGKGVIAKKIDISQMDEKVIPEFVEIEAEQELFYDKEEMSLDYDILKGVNFKQPEAQSLLVITVLKKTIESYNELIKKSFMHCEILDTGFTALFNSFEFNKSLDKNKRYMILDIGSQSTNLLILIKNQVVFARNLSIGGDFFTQRIQKDMGLEYSEAEELKISTSKDDQVSQDVSHLIKDNLSQVFCEELLSCYELYHSLFPDQNVDQGYITGGGSQTIGLTSFLENSMGFPINIFNPFQKIDFKKTLKDKKEEFKPFSSIVTGLALRSLG